MRKTQTLSILSLALAAAFAAPAAFAQSAGTQAQDPQQAPPQETTQAPPATTAQQPAPAASADPAKKTWSELDANGNGTLSATEAASMESLAKVFAKADADGNGELTADEYKAWLATNGKNSPKGKG